MKTVLECLECGKTFKSGLSDPRCPKCHGVDFEVVGYVAAGKNVSYRPKPEYVPEPDYGGVFDGIGSVFSDADPGL